MKVIIKGKELTVSQSAEARIQEKLGFLEKYFLIDNETTANVVVKKHGKDIKLEITIPTKVGILRSEVIDHEIPDAIDDSIDKLEGQIRRQKTRLSRRHKEKLAKAFLDEQVKEEVEIPVKMKRVSLEAMDQDEAIAQMELLGHTFFIYEDVASHHTCVVYKRNDGGYGVIETV